MQNPLDDNSQQALRRESIITDSEVAYSVGDKYIAENILTRTRREIQVPKHLLEGTGNRRVLKG